MAPYESYKDSGVKWLGKIPSHWDILPGKAIFEENKTKNTTNRETFVLSLSYGNIIPKLDINEGLVPENYSGYQIVEPGYIIIRCTDLQNDKVSLRTGHVNHHGIISGAYLGLKVKRGVSSRYMHYLLHNWDVSKELYRYGSGLRQSLSWADIKYLLLALPPMDEQEVIVAYLDKVTGDIDRAIEAQQKMIDALNERKQIIITRAVTRGLNPDAPLRDSGIDWLGQIPEHWEIIPMRYLCKMKTGDKDTIMRDDNGKYPFYVRSPHIEHINTYSYDGEAVLMAGDGVGAGKVFHYVNGKFDYHQRVYNFHQFKRITGEFLYFYLKCNFRYKIEEGGAKSTVDSVRLPWLKAFPICVMPKDEQQSIVEHIHKSTGPIDCALSNCERMISLLQERKQIIINEVVTGKTKVI